MLHILGEQPCIFSSCSYSRHLLQKSKCIKYKPQKVETFDRSVRGKFEPNNSRWFVKLLEHILRLTIVGVWTVVSTVQFRALSTFSALKRVSTCQSIILSYFPWWLLYTLKCNVTKQSLKHFLLFLRYVFYLSAPANTKH